MPMREDVLNCLKERLMNRSGDGPVFEKDEDYMNWLVGSQDQSEDGLLQNPGAALSRSIMRDGAAPVHPGVEISETEERELRTVMSRVRPGGIATGLTARSAALLMGSTTFIGPLLAEGGY